MSAYPRWPLYEMTTSGTEDASRLRIEARTTLPNGQIVYAGFFCPDLRIIDTVRSKTYERLRARVGDVA